MNENDERAEADRREFLADAAEDNAYAAGRSDQLAEDIELLRWAYTKLHYRSFDNLDDALMLDRFKLLLEHEVRA